MYTIEEVAEKLSLSVDVITDLLNIALEEYKVSGGSFDELQKIFPAVVKVGGQTYESFSEGQLVQLNSFAHFHLDRLKSEQMVRKTEEIYRELQYKAGSYDDRKITVELEIPNHFERDDIKRIAADFAVKLDTQYRALGGKGLKLADLEAFAITKLEDILV